MPLSVVIWFVAISNNTDGMGPCSLISGYIQLSICERNFTLPQSFLLVAAWQEEGSNAAAHVE